VQCLNQLRHRVPRTHVRVEYIILSLVHNTACFFYFERAAAGSIGHSSSQIRHKFASRLGCLDSSPYLRFKDQQWLVHKCTENMTVDGGVHTAAPGLFRTVGPLIQVCVLEFLLDVGRSDWRHTGLLTACKLSAKLYDVHHWCVQWKTPDDGQRNCPKHVEFHSENKFEKLVHLVGI